MSWDLPVRIAIQSRDETVPRFLQRNLSARQFRLCVAETFEKTVAALEKEGADILIFDPEVEGDSAALAVEVLKKIQPDLKIILLSGHPSPSDAAVIEKGIFYYMPKPVGPPLVEIILAAGRRSTG